MLYNRWWKDAGDTCNREEKNSESKASALGVDNIGKITVTDIPVKLYGINLKHEIKFLKILETIQY